MDRETVDEIKRHFDVVAEGLESKIQAVAEGVALTNERIDRLETNTTERFDRLDQRMDRLDERMDRLDQRMDRLEQRTDGVEQRMDRLENVVREGFTELRSMIKLSYAEIDRRLTSLETAHEALARRLALLENRFAS
jgi:chromosome segregation ATPase